MVEMFYPRLPPAIGLLIAFAVGPTQACNLPAAADPDALNVIQSRYSLLQDPESHESYTLDLAAFTRATSRFSTNPGTVGDAAQENLYSTCLNQLIKTLTLIEYGTREVLIDTLSITGTVDWQVYLEQLSLPFDLVFFKSDLNGLSLSGIRSARNLEFREVENRYRLFIGNSEIQGSLLLLNYIQTAFEGDDRDNVAFRISASRFNSDILFKDTSVFEVLRLHDNKMSSPFRIEGGRLGTLRLVQNHLDDFGLFSTPVDGMSFYSNTFDEFQLRTIEALNSIYIYQNTFNDTVTLDDVFAHNEISFDSNTVNSQTYLTIGSGAEPRPEVAINIGNNLMKGHVEIQLDVPALHRMLYQETNPPELAQPMVASFGRYQMQSQDTNPPETAQPMLVSLGHSVFEDVILISTTSPRATLGVHGVADPYSATPVRDYCFTEDGALELLRIDLRHARAEKVEWGLPLGDCRFRWMGEDFRFGDFELASGGASAEGVAVDDGESTMIWRFQLHRPEPSALLAMGENADDGGRFSDARQLLYDAKEMHYKPGCSDIRLDCIGKYSMFVYLWLSGFGVKPERVLAFLIVVWLAFFVVYYFYYAGMRKLANCPVAYEVPRRLVPLGRFLVSRLGGDVDTVGSITDHGDPPPGFHYYSHRKPAADFALTTFSLDATLPVVNLHLYDTYYPAKTWALVCAYVQHVFGWMLVTSLLTSVAVL